MLPRHERRRLEEIERQLAAEAPELARTLTGTRLRDLLLAWKSPSVVLAAVAAGTSVLCLLLGEGTGTLTATGVATALITFRNWRVETE